MTSFIDKTKTLQSFDVPLSIEQSLQSATLLEEKVQRDSTTPLIEKFYRAMSYPIRLLPNFLIIGTQRGGTTSLYHYLQAHPCIGSASTKEIHFFDRRFNRGLAWYRGHFPSRIEQAYAQYLSGRPFLTGEATPCYLFYPHAPERVARTLPDVKLIVLLRNPVDRAYSQYIHTVNLGYETASFQEAIHYEEERIGGARARILQDEHYEGYAYMHLGYLARGKYVDQLQVWMSLFPREQLLILKSEEFYADPASAFKQVLAFLNIPEAEPHVQKQAYKQYNNNDYAKMDQETRKRLIEYFEPHNARLYDYLGVNFGWDK
jgi:hypothetical protein